MFTTGADEKLDMCCLVDPDAFPAVDRMTCTEVLRTRPSSSTICAASGHIGKDRAQPT